MGDIVFGGLGTGLCGMIMIALVAVFLGGLMVGRTPEYLGKKITAGETTLTILYALLTPLVMLVLTGVAIATNAGRAGLVTNGGARGGGARGLTEVLFAYASHWPWLGDSQPSNAGQRLRGRCPAIPRRSAPWCLGPSCW